VNFLGQFYVVNQLWPLLRKTAKMPDTPPPRVVFESSEQHRNAPKVVHFGSLDEINNPEIGSTEVYGRTKLAIILGVKYGLLERVIKPNKDNIYALSVHPGAVRFFSSRLSVGCIANWGQVNTAMQQQWKDAYPGLLGKLLTTAMLAVGRNVEQGSYSALYAATSPEIEEKGWNGYYFSDVAQPGKESAQASDPMLGAALWDLSHRLIKEKVGEDGLVDWNA
jgi:NAD(P)-dependent dehydrogenase (short-subunit alcohol dehydrogenase family)